MLQQSVLQPEHQYLAVLLSLSTLMPQLQCQLLYFKRKLVKLHANVLQVLSQFLNVGFVFLRFSGQRKQLPPEGDQIL